ncbi:ribonuclease H-like domain-containing protein [Mycena metata]|uniref:Ribonuclease H-like domain-containing protein n=1 Tax=Mycena metata TaxID=1033252 RepID=A0AAD7JI61_9AGAR|nr:ribonuclease H-like domain-containing protein [Mycena metata]KAJ7765349.1 ribonuclease H-like domain-containing protein [Mycena metata]
MAEFNAVDVTILSHIDQTRTSTQYAPMSEPDFAIMETSLVAMAKLGVEAVTYLTNEIQANEELRSIENGVVGFDTEFVKRVLVGDEDMINEIPTMAVPYKKAARTAFQLLEARRPGFVPDWEHAGLCLVQIAHGNRVWVLNICRIKAIPSELQRILTSTAITKSGAGVSNDAMVLWEDARIQVNQMADVGLMTRLLQVDIHPDDAFTHLALETAATDILNITMDKTYQKSVNWKLDPHEAHIAYAALDAVVSLRIFERLDVELSAVKQRHDVVFSKTWYTFNSTLGEPVRSRKSVRNEDIPWSTKDCSWFSGGKFQGRYY